MKISFNNQEEFLESIKENFGSLDNLRVIGLEKLGQYQQRNTRAMEAEYKRLLETNGVEHPDVAIMEKRLATSQAFRRNLDMETERSRVVAVKQETGTWRVQGQVIDDEQQAVPRLTVSLYDGKSGRWIREAGYACTGSQGHFSLMLSPELTKKYHSMPVVLTVTDGEQKVLLQDKNTLEIVPDGSDYRMLMLPNAKCSTPPPEPKEGEEETTSTGDFIIAGIVLDNDSGRPYEEVPIRLHISTKGKKGKIIGETMSGKGGSFEFVLSQENFQQLLKQQSCVLVQVLNDEGVEVFPNSGEIKVAPRQVYLELCIE